MSEVKRKYFRTGEEAWKYVKSFGGGGSVTTEGDKVYVQVVKDDNGKERPLGSSPTPSTTSANMSKTDREVAKAKSNLEKKTKKKTAKTGCLSNVGKAIEAMIDQLPWPINWLVILLWWIIKGIYWIISLPFKIIFSLFHQFDFQCKKSFQLEN